MELEWDGEFLTIQTGRASIEVRVSWERMERLAKEVLQECPHCGMPLSE